jgi:hypothetical protein
MSEESSPDHLSLTTAEEVLRTIFGDDLAGCTVTLEQVGKVIQEGTDRRGIKELIELYEKLVEAIHLLSTPPDKAKIGDPAELQSLLGQRLDAIHSLTTKTLQTTAPFRRSSPDDE